MSESSDEVPAGFRRVERRSPFLDLLGALHVADGPVYGLRVEERHTNNRGGLHGGVVTTLADLALGYTLAFSVDPPLALTTASLTVDFVGAAAVGDWLEARTTIVRTGRTLAFATCALTVGDRAIAQASGVFAVAAGRLLGT